MKKTICLLLAVVLTAALVIPVSAKPVVIESKPITQTSDEAIAAYEKETGEKVETRRYYFIMPDGVHGMRDEYGNVIGSWYNEYSRGAGVFWWGDYPAACDFYPGYRAMTADAAQHIYYVNMPASVINFIWNNGIESEESKLEYIRQTIDVPCEDAYEGEYDSMPEGTDSFDNCIFVPYPDYTGSVFMPIRPEKGTWYFYYGDGCYGMYAQDSEKFKSVEENCCNPDHYDEDGKHIGYVYEAIRGDYVKDSEITILDATRVQRILSDLDERPDDAFLKAVDADGDDELTVLDATRIQRVLAGMCDWDGNAVDEYESPLER